MSIIHKYSRRVTVKDVEDYELPAIEAHPVDMSVVNEANFALDHLTKHQYALESYSNILTTAIDNGRGIDTSTSQVITIGLEQLDTYYVENPLFPPGESTKFTTKVGLEGFMDSIKRGFAAAVAMLKRIWRWVVTTVQYIKGTAVKDLVKNVRHFQNAIKEAQDTAGKKYSDPQDVPVPSSIPVNGVDAFSVNGETIFSKPSRLTDLNNTMKFLTRHYYSILDSEMVEVITSLSKVVDEVDKFAKSSANRVSPTENTLEQKELEAVDGMMTKLKDAVVRIRTRLRLAASMELGSGKDLSNGVRRYSAGAVIGNFEVAVDISNEGVSPFRERMMKDHLAVEASDVADFDTFLNLADLVSSINIQVINTPSASSGSVPVISFSELTSLEKLLSGRDGRGGSIGLYSELIKARSIKMDLTMAKEMDRVLDLFLKHSEHYPKMQRQNNYVGGLLNPIMHVIRQLTELTGKVPNEVNRRCYVALTETLRTATAMTELYIQPENG